MVDCGETRSPGLGISSSIVFGSVPSVFVRCEMPAMIEMFDGQEQAADHDEHPDGLRRGRAARRSAMQRRYVTRARFPPAPACHHGGGAADTVESPW